jgi:hypothetical protein
MARNPGDGGPERAARLSEQIEQIVHPAPQTTTPAADGAPTSAKQDAESPHQFVQRRMRELDQAKEPKPG